MSYPVKTLAALLVSASLLGCNDHQESNASATQVAPSPLTAEDAQAFLERAQSEIEKIQTPAAHAQWSYATNINMDTGAVAAYMNEQYSNLVASLAQEAASFNHVEVDADTRRKLDLLRNGLTMPPPV